MIAAGRFRDRVTLESRTQGKDAYGGMVETWTAFAADVPAEVRLYSGEERKATAHGGQLPIARTEVRMRWRDLATPGCRVVWNGANYNIRSRAGSRREGYMILVCDTGADNGR